MDTDGNISLPSMTQVIASQPYPGDINGNGRVDLIDAIMVLQVATGRAQNDSVNKRSDVNGNGKIGLAEVIDIMQKTAGVR